MNNLESEIEKYRREIATDSYSMSVGELTNLYRDGELNVHPEFQRFFRWTVEQKSRLIESVLLGIPLPSIFVAQTGKGIWELVDGLQRVCTLLELQGVLRDDYNRVLPPLQLVGTKFLSALNEKLWESEDESRSLTQAQRLDIKRAKLDVKIVKRESSASSKYDLFQRLNSYGAQLTAQELRSCLIVSTSRDVFSWLRELASYPPFANTISLSDRLIEEQYDIELVLRFLILHDINEAEIPRIRSFSAFLDDRAVLLAEKSTPTQRESLTRVFKATFDAIEANGGEDVFRRYNRDKKVFQGPFLNTSYEVFAMGVGFHLVSGTEIKNDLAGAAKRLWARSDMASGFATGVSTESRLSKTLPLGRRIVAA
jgi:hypothetical protein